MKKISKITIAAVLSTGLLFSGIVGALLIENSNNPKMAINKATEAEISAVNDTPDTDFQWKGDNLGYNPVSFLNQLITDGAVIDGYNEWILTPTNVELLKNFFEFISPVPDTEYHLEVLSQNYSTGYLEAYIILSTGWTGGTLGDWWYRLNFDLHLLPAPPSAVSVKDGYPKTLTPGKFKNAVTTNGSTVKRSGMANYIQNMESIPHDANITLKNFQLGEAVDGLIDDVTFDLTFSKWISETKQVVENTITGFSLTLAPQHAATAYKANVDVPKDITPSGFVEALRAGGATEVKDQQFVYKLTETNILLLNKFGKFTNVIENSTWWIEIIGEEDELGMLQFQLFADMVYNNDGVEQGSLGAAFNNSHRVGLNMTFMIANSDHVPPKTEIVTKPDSPETTNENTFLDSLKNADGSWNLSELAKYVDGLNTIPTLANVKDITLKTETDGKYVFEIKVSGWWNGVNNVMEPETNYSFEVKSSNATSKSSETNQFQWWWIVIAIGGAAFIGLVIWFSMKKTYWWRRKSTDGEPKQELSKGEKKKSEEKMTSKRKTKPIDAKKKVEKTKTFVSKPKPKVTTLTNSKSIDKPAEGKKVNSKPKPKSQAKKPSAETKTKK